jgi:hypothetical protein
MNKASRCAESRNLFVLNRLGNWVDLINTSFILFYDRSNSIEKEQFATYIFLKYWRMSK